MLGNSLPINNLFSFVKWFLFYIQFDICDAAEIVVFMCYNIKVIVSYVENFSAAVVEWI